MAQIIYADGQTIEIESTSFKDIVNAVDEDYIEEITDEIDCYDWKMMKQLLSKSTQMLSFTKHSMMVARGNNLFTSLQ